MYLEVGIGIQHTKLSMFDVCEGIVPVLSPCSSYCTGQLLISARKDIECCVDMVKDGKKLFVFSARASIDSFKQGMHPTLEINFETYLANTYT